MQLNKIGLLALSAAIFVCSACGTAEQTNSKPSANNSNAANTAVSNQTNANKTNTVSNTPSKSSNNSNVNKTLNSVSTASDTNADVVDGELQVGKNQSVILYFGEESGDYAGYCFPNDSEAGRAILKACKNKQQCEVKGKVDYEAACQVPGLEADLSAAGKILTVTSVKSLGRK